MSQKPFDYRDSTLNVHGQVTFVSPSVSVKSSVHNLWFLGLEFRYKCEIMYVVSSTEFNLLSKHTFVLYFNIMMLPVKACSTM